MSKYTIREIIVMGIFLLAILVVGLLILNKQDIDEVNLLVSASNEEIVDHIFYQANAKKTLLEENRLTLTTYDLPFDAALFTDYYQGDFVVYDGSLWEALIDVPYDPETGANVIPRNIGSYTVWKEYPVVWDFGRN